MVDGVAVCSKCGEEKDGLRRRDYVDRDGTYHAQQICWECRPKARTANAVGCFALAIMCVVPPLALLTYCSNQQQQAAEQKAAQDAADKAEYEKKQAEDQRTGRYCVNGWDGSVPTFVERVKARLRDPSSFEHVETYFTPEDKHGLHKVTMKFRSRNGFGGMTAGIAEGSFFGSKCRASVSNIAD